MEVAGPDLAGSLTNLGPIDEYRLYLRPIVLGRATYPTGLGVYTGIDTWPDKQP